MRHRLGRARLRHGGEDVGLGGAADRVARDFGADVLGAIAQLERQPRVPGQFLERFLPPLTAAIDRELESVARERLHQEVGDRRALFVEQRRVRRREDDGGVRVVDAAARRRARGRRGRAS